MFRPTCLAIPILAAAFAQPAQADDLFHWIESKPLGELWLNPGFYSYHFNRDKDLNNGNYGFGAEYRFSTVASATAGRFYNSNRHYSNYVGIYYQPFAIGPVRLGVVAGAFNGYPKMRDGGWFPAVIPMISYESGRFGLNVAILPSYQDKLYGAMAFQLKFKLLD